MSSKNLQVRAPSKENKEKMLSFVMSFPLLF
jgi:hypothetical protein